MASPFPGMDPYLEGYLWADVHQGLAAQLRRQLAPLVAPRYVVRLAVAMIADRVPADELGIMYPDVEVVRPHTTPQVEATIAGTGIAPAPLTIALAIPTQTRQVTLEVRDAAQQQLVTAIEILSPANKRAPGHGEYLRKRDELRAAGVHVLEIDLLRRGTRSFSVEQLPPTTYLVALLRARQPIAEVWPLSLRDVLPTLPVPLQPPDADVPLDLQQALTTIYAEAHYELTIDYAAPAPDPRLAPDDAAWVAACIHNWQADRLPDNTSLDG